jgi:hypothetical protein
MWELTEQQLQDLGDIFIDFYKKKITEKIYPYGNPKVRGLGNKVASGKLLNSLSAKVKDTPDGLMLELSYMDYLKNVNFGRKPKKKKVPVNVLLQWIKDKRIRGRNKKGRFIKDLSFAFAVQQNIFKYGIRPTNIFDKTYDSFEDVLLNPPPQLSDQYTLLYDAIGQDVENFLIQTINQEIESIK